jgi:hypothetical protein
MFFRLMLLLALIAAMSQNSAYAADYRSCTASEIGRYAGAAGGLALGNALLTTTPSIFGSMPLCAASGPLAPFCVGAVIATGVAAGALAGHLIGSSIDGCR